MKYCRFTSAHGPAYGLIENVGGSEQITQAMPGHGVPHFNEARKIAPEPLATATLLAPVQPAKIVCVGRNYADHAKEFGNEVPPDLIIFLKPQTSLFCLCGSIMQRDMLS